MNEVPEPEHFALAADPIIYTKTEVPPEPLEEPSDVSRE